MLLIYNVYNQVRQVKPDVLLGLSAVGGLFSKEVITMKIFYIDFLFLLFFNRTVKFT